MGGGGHTTNTVETNNQNSQIANTFDNTENVQNKWNVNHSTTNVQDGDEFFNRSVAIDNSANAGLRCIGMPAGDPRCKALLQLQNLAQSHEHNHDMRY